MEFHVRVAAIANIALAIFGLLMTVLIFLTLGGPITLYENGELGIILAGWGIYNVLLAGPCVACAIGLLKFRNWARTGMTILSGLHLLNVPFGSAVAGYTIWVLLAEESELLFKYHTQSTAKAARKAGPVLSGEQKLIRPDSERPILRSRNADTGHQ